MKRLALLLLFASPAFTGVTITESPPSIELHSMPDNKMVPGPWPPSVDACKKQGTDLVLAGKLGDFACVTRNSFKVAVTCADEKAPKLYLAKVMIEGAEYLELPGASFTEDIFIEMADLFVHGPTWPGGYPNCWVRGVAPRSEWRLNTKDEPGKAFMERRDPAMPPGDLIAEEPNSVEPVCWPGDDCTQVPAP